MNREETTSLALSAIDKAKFLILELATGYGKTKIAIDCVNHICKKIDHQPSILILVAKTVHKQTWKDELRKWGGINSNDITIECYESFKKYRNRTFDIIISDEAQHLSELRLEILNTLTIKEAFIGLSATIKKDMKLYFKYVYHAEIISCGLKTAIESEILPEPKVYLLPLLLDSKTFSYKINKFGKEIITTQRGYYTQLSSQIDWYKNKYMNSRNNGIKTKWLSLANQRLKWCAEQKEGIVLKILDKLKKQRTLTFCNNIEEAERLGKYNITSKNKDSIKNLQLFNSGKIKHITACHILNEGVNLTNCRVGIFCNLNSSEIITKQRMGRLLRHKFPVIILPYFKGTREEDLVFKMIQEYPRDAVCRINSINEIKL